jgi:hypothetical protein
MKRTWADDQQERDARNQRIIDGLRQEANKVKIAEMQEKSNKDIDDLKLEKQKSDNAWQERWTN